MRRILLIIVGLLGGLITLEQPTIWLSAATCDATQCIWTLSWSEPTTKTSGAALDNLQYTTLFQSVNGGAATTYQKTASSVSGGGTQTQSVTITTPTCQNTVAVFSATATNPNGTSNASSQVQVNRDRTGDVACNVPTIGRGPASLIFTGVEAGANPANQTISLTNAGTGTLSWTTSDNATWLSVSPASGTTTTETDTLTVSINSAGLTVNAYYGTVTIAAAGASNTPQTVTVQLIITAASPAPSVYTGYSATDAKTVPSAPSLPVAGSSFTDPTFGSRILRVTDSNTASGASFITDDAGSFKTWNADATAIKLRRGNGTSYWMTFNPSTFAVSGLTALTGLDQNWEWSATNPDLLYYLNGTNLAKYNKATLTPTNLAAPTSGQAVAYHAVVVGADNWVCSAELPGAQDTYSHLFCVNPANTTQVKNIDLINKKINGVTSTDPNWPVAAGGQTLGVHGISGSAGCCWLGVTLTGASIGGNGETVFNLTTETWSLITTADIFWGGHTVVGAGLYANSPSSQNGLDARGLVVRDPNDLMNTARYVFAMQPPSSVGFFDADHLSWANAGTNPIAPILSSRYNVTTPGSPLPWYGEIVAAATDGSNRVWRFAHNHNGGGYFGQADAQISRDGKWAVFYSYWDGGLGASSEFGLSSRIDTFIVELLPAAGPSPPNVTYTMNGAGMSWLYKQTTVAWTQTGTCDAPCVTEIEWTTNSVPSFTKVGQVAFGQLTFVHSYVPNASDTFLCYRVRASNSAGTSTYSDQQCNVMPTAPTISLNPTSISFTAVQGGANPAAKTVAINNSGGGSMSWTRTKTGSWLTVTPASGTAPSTLTLTAAVGSLTPGSYQGTVTITASGASNTPQTIPVTFTVTASPPTIALSPTSLTFSGTQGGANPATQTITVTNSATGAAAMAWTASDNATWLTLNNTGSTPGTITATASLTGLAAGTYSATITVSATGATNTPQLIPVTFTVNAAAVPPTIGLSATSLSFSGAQAGANPASQTLSITNPGGQTLTWTLTVNQSWLLVNPTSGTTTTETDTVTVNVVTAGLAQGTFNGVLTVTAAGASNTPQTVPVTLTITSPSPTIALSPTSLTFTGVAGGSAPPAQSIGITNSGGQTLSWTATDNATWLTVSPISGVAPSTLTVTTSTTGLTAGTYTGTITISATGATNTPRTASVTLIVTAVPPPSATIGVGPTSFSFSGVQNGQNPATQPLGISNTGSGTLTWAVSEGATWLTLTPTSGTTTTEVDVVTLTVSTASLTPNTYTATITVTDTGATNSPVTVPVTLLVMAPPTPPTISFFPSAFNFQTVGATNPGTQTLTISEGGGGAAMSWSVSDNASWLSLSPTSGLVTPSTVTLTVDATGLPVGLYSGIVTITAVGASNTPQAIPVTLLVPNPLITLNGGGFTFAGVQGGSNPTNLTLNLTNTGAGTLSWSTSDDGAWLTIAPGSGTTTTETDVLTASVDLTALTAGTYRANFTITAAGADNTPQVLPVVLEVTAATPEPPPISEPPPPPPVATTPQSVGSPSFGPYIEVF